MKTSVLLVLLGACIQLCKAQVIGRVQHENEPVPFVNLRLEGTTFGAATGTDGAFRINGVPAGEYQLIATSVGYHPIQKKITTKAGVITDLGTLQMIPSAHGLNEVVVTGTMKEISRLDSPIPVEIATPKLFQKNAEASLLNSIGMVNGVRPQLNCSVCNTGDIHINGMEGPYTMVLVDGMPIVSSLGTVYGLSGIPNSMVERIEIVKGPAGALYGSEAMGGMINVITRDPGNSPRFSVDGFTTSWNERNLDLSATFPMGLFDRADPLLLSGRAESRPKNKVKGLLSLSGFQYNDPRDHNNDGFTDLTLQDRISVFGKVDVDRPKARRANIALRYLHEDRWGGEMNWTPEFLGGDSIYGESIATRRTELIAQYQLPTKEKLMTQFSFIDHAQDSYYGDLQFVGDQQVAFGQLWWDKKIGAQHELLLGGSYRHTLYDDNTPGTSLADGGNAPQTTPLPGLFIQDEWRFAPEQTLLLGYRADVHPLHGTVSSPRIAYRWKPQKNSTLRASLGTGFRVVNLFTEDHAALTGSRDVVIGEELQPERSVGGVLNYVRHWSTDKHFFLIDLSAFHTRFSNQIIGDFDTDPDQIIFSNLDGHAVSQGLTMNTEAVIGGPWKVLAGASWMDVFSINKMKEGGEERRQLLFAPEWSGTFTVTYRPSAWTVDLTGQWYGPMRLPILPNDPRPEYSPTYAIMNLQVTRKLKNSLEIYAGVKNLLDLVPENALLRSHDPFDKLVDDPIDNPDGLSFDTAYMYAPLQGVRGSLGVRWRLR